MKTYVAFVGDKAVLAFRAEDDDQAQAMIDDEEGSIRSDLKVLIGADEKRRGQRSFPLTRIA